MRFEWDPEKARSNLAKHGVSFQLAEKVFDDPLSIATVDRHVDGEERWRTVGRVGFTLVLFVAHTYPGETGGEIVVRIIGARRASKLEIRAYERGDEGFFR